MVDKLQISVDDPNHGTIIREWFPIGIQQHTTALVLLHGGGGSIERWIAQTNIIKLVQQGRIAADPIFLQGICYNPNPDSPTPNAHPEFDVGQPSCILSDDHRLDGEKVNGHLWSDGRIATYSNEFGFIGYDDVFFISQMVAVLRGPFGYTKVLIMGGSNGGNMAQRYVTERASSIDGALFIASAMSISYQPSVVPGPKKIWYEHGTGDPLMPWSGGSRLQESSNPVDQRISYWKGQNGILPSTPADIVTPIPNDNTGDGCKAFREDFTSGTEDMVVVTIQNGGHTVRNAAVVPDPILDDERPGLTCHDGDVVEEFVEWALAA